MQAVILAAGKSTRLFPFNARHKSMIPLLGKPIIEHTIERLKELGIEEVVIVESQTNSISSHLKDGKQWGISITYVIQPEPLGMGDALLLAKEYLHSDFLLFHAHHVDIDLFAKLLLTVKAKNAKAVLLAEEREDFWKYGVLETDNERVKNLVEKPRPGEEPSRLCVIGMYLLTKDFLSILEKIPTHHYHFEEALAKLAKEHVVRFVKAPQRALTFKYPWDLLELKNYLLKHIKKHVGKNVSIAESAQIIGNVFIEDNVEIMEGARIKGPCYIGKNVKIGNNALVRNGTDVEEDSVVGAYMEVKNSLLMKGASTHSGFIGDSVIGERSKIGAQFCSANVRIDRKNVQAEVGDKKINTGLRTLGALIGSEVKVGIKSSTMPGIIIGSKTIIGPSTTVLHNVASNSNYYTKFSEIVEEQKEG